MAVFAENRHQVLTVSRSALVEEAARGRLWRLYFVRRHLDMSRGQQEDLAGDPLDGAVEAEHEACGEVHETLGVSVVQVGEVHDHRSAVTEALADVLGFVVGPR